MTLIDANILMYAAGAPHPSKAPSAQLLEQIALGQVNAALDAEVLQEVLHRYRAIDRWTAGSAVYDDARQLFDTVLPISSEVTDRARRLLHEHKGISARDAIHAAVALVHSLDSLCSYDRGFDAVPTLVRVTPGDLVVPTQQ